MLETIVETNELADTKRSWTPPRIVRIDEAALLSLAELDVSFANLVPHAHDDAC